MRVLCEDGVVELDDTNPVIQSSECLSLAVEDGVIKVPVTIQQLTTYSMFWAIYEPLSNSEGTLNDIADNWKSMIDECVMVYYTSLKLCDMGTMDLCLASVYTILDHIETTSIDIAKDYFVNHAHDTTKFMSSTAGYKFKCLGRSLHYLLSTVMDTFPHDKLILREFITHLPIRILMKVVLVPRGKLKGMLTDTNTFAKRKYPPVYENEVMYGYNCDELVMNALVNYVYPSGYTKEGKMSKLSHVERILIKCVDHDGVLSDDDMCDLVTHIPSSVNKCVGALHKYCAQNKLGGKSKLGTYLEILRCFSHDTYLPLNIEEKYHNIMRLRYTVSYMQRLVKIMTGKYRDSSTVSNFSIATSKTIRAVAAVRRTKLLFPDVNISDVHRNVEGAVANNCEIAIGRIISIMDLAIPDILSHMREVFDAMGRNDISVAHYT